MTLPDNEELRLDAIEDAEQTEGRILGFRVEAVRLRAEIRALQQLVATLQRDAELSGACIDRLRRELGESEGARAVTAKRLKDVELILALHQREGAQA
jgi:hypothetical protein